MIVEGTAMWRSRESGVLQTSVLDSVGRSGYEEVGKRKRLG